MPATDVLVGLRRKSLWNQVPPRALERASYAWAAPEITPDSLRVRVARPTVSEESVDTAPDFLSEFRSRDRPPRKLHPQVFGR